jgi:hypothetical protein
MPAMTEADALIVSAGPVGSALTRAARNRGVPLRGLDRQRPKAATYYGGGLVLSRPDQHVAWRGDKLPADSLALVDRVRGAASQGSEARSGHARPLAQSSFAAIDSIKDTS